jgi:GINS complex subunit 4
MSDWQAEWDMRGADSNRPRRTAVNEDDDGDVPMREPSAHNGVEARRLSKEKAAEEETPFEKLIRHWMNERHAPDILPAQEDLLSSILDHLRRQVCSVSFS